MDEPQLSLLFVVFFSYTESKYISLSPVVLAKFRDRRG